MQKVFKHGILIQSSSMAYGALDTPPSKKKNQDMPSKSLKITFLFEYTPVSYAEFILNQNKTTSSSVPNPNHQFLSFRNKTGSPGGCANLWRWVWWLNMGVEQKPWMHFF